MKEVLMVAEKPNLAQTISGLLSNDSARKGCIDRRLSKGLPLYEWNGPWPATGEVVHYKMTSTYGHVCQIDVCCLLGWILYRNLTQAFFAVRTICSRLERGSGTALLVCHRQERAR